MWDKFLFLAGNPLHRSIHSISTEIISDNDFKKHNVPNLKFPLKFVFIFHSLLMSLESKINCSTRVSDIVFNRF